MSNKKLGVQEYYKDKFTLRIRTYILKKFDFS